MAVDDMGNVLRRLLPFPAAADESLLQVPLIPLKGSIVPDRTIPGSAEKPAIQQAATIVSDAAAILDEEMGRGELAARAVGPAPHRPDPDQGVAILRQLHDLIDNVARIWPTVQHLPRPWPDAASPTANTGAPEALPIVKPASALRPGQQGTISMMLCNNEDRVVRLTPISTDLVSCAGSRIPAQCLAFVPGDVRLDPKEQREMQGRITVPVGSSPGSYFGLLIVAGVNYLRALIAIEVA